MKIRRKDRTIVLVQKTRLWFRAGVCLWTLIVLLGTLMIYSMLFGSTTIRFTCDRAAGTCEIDGRTRDVPRLADIVSAKMDRDFNRRDGVNWGIDLVTREGKPYAIDAQRAIDGAVVAEYRATVKTINAFLATPAQKTLDTSFTYRAGVWEKIQSLVMEFSAIVILIAGYSLWTKTTYIFEPDRVTLVRRWAIESTTEELAAVNIARITNRSAIDGRHLELQLHDRGRFTVVQTSRENTVDMKALGEELSECLGKPLESVPG